MRMLPVVLSMILAVPAYGADALTWQDANKRSAEAIRVGKLADGAELAHKAFELYENGSSKYSVNNHAQLLLNSVDAHEKAHSPGSALEELGEGIPVVSRKAGAHHPVMLDLWLEGVRVSKQTTSWGSTDRYYANAVAVAVANYTEDDARAISLHARWVGDVARFRSYDWGRKKLLEAHERAGKLDPEGSLVSVIEMILAKLAMGRKKAFDEAAAYYRRVIERLERRKLPIESRMLTAAYAQLAHASRQSGKPAEADAAWASLSALHRVSPDVPKPVQMVAPKYPAIAQQSGLEGFVLMKVIVGADGTVQAVDVITSEPTGTFDAVAVDAVKRWTFAPAPDGAPWSGIQKIGFTLQ